MKAAGLAAIKRGSYISVPLARDGAFKFLLAITDTAPREWRVDEIKWAQELTTRIWMRLEKARAEEALAASEEKYRSVFEAMDEGFAIQEFLTDEQDNIVDIVYHEANAAFVRCTGLRQVPDQKASGLFPHLEQH